MVTRAQDSARIPGDMPGYVFMLLTATGVAFFAGARILGATRASMFTLFEPALAAFVAWLIFGENFTPPQWAGFAVVLLALFLFERRARARR